MTRFLNWGGRLIACMALAGAGFIVCQDAEARIQRSGAEVRAFMLENPCPATGRRRGSCPGYQVDHTVPLCAGGEDHRSNMKWLSVEDHKWKTFVDVRECRKLAKRAELPAIPGESHDNPP